MSLISWTGGAGGDDSLNGGFRNSENWSSGTVPTQQDDVTLGAGDYKVLLSSAKSHISNEVHSLSIGQGVQLQVNDPGNIVAFYQANKLTVDNGLTNNGTIILGGGQLDAQITDTAASTIRGWGYLEGSGTITGTIIAGNVNKGPLTLMGHFDLTGAIKGAALSLSGTVAIDPGASLSVAELSMGDLVTIHEDLDLRHTQLNVYGVVSNYEYTLTIKNAVIDSGKLYAGTLVNTGSLDIRNQASIYGDVINKGLITVSNGSDYTTYFLGNLQGKGNVEIEDGATLDLSGGTVLHGQTINLDSLAHLTLEQNAWEGFQGDISGFGGSNMIELKKYQDGFGDVSLTYVPDHKGHSGTLTFGEGAESISMHLVGDYSVAGFSAERTSYGDFDLSYHAPTSEAVMSGSILHV